MRRDAIAILDYTSFFTDNIKLCKSFQQRVITLKNKNCIKYFRKINLEENEVITEIMKMNNYLDKDEFENFTINNLLKHGLIVVLKNCKRDEDLKELNKINKILEEKNLSILNIIYTKNIDCKNIDVKGKIIIPLAKEEQVLFKETNNVYNSILSLMDSNKKILFG